MRPLFGGMPSPPSFEGTSTTRLPWASWKVQRSNSKPTSQTSSSTPERLQRAQRVAGLVDADAVDVRLGLDLDDLDLDAALRERRARAEAADAGADDEDLADVGHGPGPQWTLAAAQGFAASGLASARELGAAAKPSIIESGIATLR